MQAGDNSWNSLQGEQVLDDGWEAEYTFMCSSTIWQAL